ncbi:MAG: response regulator transcription factor, partial [Pseudomonadota bacterium]|nr:response regulator transcription factor [Pseudomonadota bacterium]
MTETPAPQDDTLNETPVKLVIVDDHPMVAEGIQSILESYDDIEVQATFQSGRAIIDEVEALRPDVILMDLNMPDIGGLSATEIILERCPDTRILILTMHDSREYISTALDHGAMGYVLKDVPTDEIKTAIDTVMRGERYLCTGAQGSLEPANGR